MCNAALRKRHCYNRPPKEPIRTILTRSMTPESMTLYVRSSRHREYERCVMARKSQSYKAKSARESKRYVCFFGITALQLLANADETVKSAKPGRVPPFFPKAKDRDRIMNDLVLHIGQGCASYPLHILVGRHTGSERDRNWCSHLITDALPDKSIVSLTEDIQCVNVGLAFLQEAARRSLVKTIILGFELCGTYRNELIEGDTVYQTKPLTDVINLRRMVERCSNLAGSQTAKEALRYVRDGSASPAETSAAMLFGLPCRLGGYGLGMPDMNVRKSCGNTAKRLTDRTHLICDLYWKEGGIDLEYQSRDFHSGELNRIRDSRRANALKSMGINYVSITNDELMNMAAVDAVASTIAAFMGKRIRTRYKDYVERKRALRNALGLPVERLTLYPWGEDHDATEHTDSFK